MSDRIRTDARAPQWAQALREEVERAIEALFQAPFRLKGYDAAALPPPARFEGALVYVRDTGQPAFSNGTAWTYFDGTPV